jgi:DHA1 family multidrug resistance protein-like MFS transporter
MVLGPALGGWLAVDSLSTPFFITAGVCLLTLLLVVLFLPESLPAEARRSTATQIKPAAQLGEMWRALSSRPLGILLTMAFLVSFGLTCFQGIFGLYALERFGYGTEEVGWILAVVGIVAALTQGVLTGPLTKRWGEAVVIKVTLLGSAVAFVLLLTANTLPAVLLTIALFTVPNALLRPAVISLTSKRADTEQGVAMGLNNSFNSLGRIAGPIWAGFVFDVDYRLPYLSGAAILVAGFVISLMWLPGQEETAGVGVRSEA